ncbi:MAG: protein translocase subunit SecD [Acidobacteria bacterium]|nr:protein translocase subunit SecD [Acidobacteriota bacterium]MBI3472159.1 protein translocase subunit SecD [Candidatus Solibacter usitatus]
MQKNLTTKTIVIAVTILLCIYGIVGLPKSKDELKKNLEHNIRLGLDLRGGSYLILQVQVQDAVKSEADQSIERIKEDVRKQNVDFASLDRNDPPRIEDADTVQINIKGIPAQKSSQFRSLINERFSNWVLTPVNSTDYRMNMRPSELLVLKRDTVERAIQTIKNRIDNLGVAEPVVQQHGRADAEFEISVQLPGVDDPARVKEIIGTTAVLGIHEVKDGPFSSQEQALSKHGGLLPVNTKMAKSVLRGERGEEWYLVTRTPVVTGQELRNARAGQAERRWETSFTLSQEGGRKFGRYTQDNIGNRLAVLLDQTIVSVATIESKIEDSGRITNLGSEQEASNLAQFLKSGSLPAGIVFRAESSVGPSLGADSIKQGLAAGTAGLAAVVIAMLVYYRRSGVNAVLALLLNTIILIAALSYLDATLTLPGIAGVILTIGMAVDSNVLIFERIREELRGGKTIVSAVDTGFSKAWWTIVDTHVTTIVSCAFLFMFGTGPVRGFAVTLVIGLFANVFTAVFVSKVIFDFELSRSRQLTTLSI